MKFIGLLGSPNAAGRTRLVADAIARGIIGANGQVEIISVADEPSDEVIDACDTVYGAKTQLDMPPTENSYHINLTTKGRTFAARTDGSRAVTVGHSSGLVLLPDQLNSVR